MEVKMARKTDLCSPDVLADEILSAMRRHGDNISNLKLQKLLYYTQAWHLALFRKPIFGEDFRAWVHGPVLPSQYHRFKRYSWAPITEATSRHTLPSGVRAHLEDVLKVFGTETALSLERMTHQEAPWVDARGNLPRHAPSSAIIPQSAMEKYYRRLAGNGETTAS